MWKKSDILNSLLINDSPEFLKKLLKENQLSKCGGLWKNNNSLISNIDLVQYIKQITYHVQQKHLLEIEHVNDPVPLGIGGVYIISVN